MGIVFGCVAPHPPLLIPDVGHGQEKAIQATTDAMNRLADELAEADPQTLVVISPHGRGHGDAMGVLTATGCAGNMRQWGSSLPQTAYRNDLELVAALQQEAATAHIPVKSIDDKEYQLDHGSIVPMYFLGAKARGIPVVPMTFSYLPLPYHFALGQALRLAAERTGKRVAVIASGDLSHRLTQSAPSGYDPEGQVFDQHVVRAVREMDHDVLLNLNPVLVERAGECGLRSIVILLGALEALEVTPQVHSYEGPFGVGYMVASLPVKGPRQPHPIVSLARETIERYVREGKTLKPGELTPEMKERAPVFVSIKKFGELRGCIGTYDPARENVALETIANAVSAATQDPRFYPVSVEELPYLCYSVDVLTRPQKVTDRGMLDPKRYGIIVEHKGKRGLLLPDLEGVDTVEEQILICSHKAGISPQDPVDIYCFEVKRYR